MKSSKQKYAHTKIHTSVLSEQFIETVNFFIFLFARLFLDRVASEQKHRKVMAFADLSTDEEFSRGEFNFNFHFVSAF